MRKQPFKTKFTPYFKLDWGTNYPPAKYPTRQKRPLHTFDIKEFVKSQKKKKLLEMMNSNDEKDNDNDGLAMPGIPGMPMAGPFGGGMSGDLRQPKSTSSNNIPDFLTRKNDDIVKEENLPKIPDFETFKKQMEASAFGVDDDVRPMTSEPKKSENIVLPSMVNDDVEDDDDDLGFDVDELVKKIDAKIAELEAEEKRNKELEEAKKNMPQQDTIPSVTSTPFNDLSSLGEEITFEVNNPKYEEIEDFESQPIQPLGTDVPQEVRTDNKPIQVNLNLEEESDDDDFFDDFFDN
jgi:hypothetical protein